MRGRSYPAAYPEVLNPVPAFYGGSVVRVLSMQDGAGSSRSLDAGGCSGELRKG